jgi:hypothetical protein
MPIAKGQYVFLSPPKGGNRIEKQILKYANKIFFQKVKKSHSPIIQESGGGKCPPLAGIRKPLAESGACEKNGEQALEEIHLMC